MRVLTLRGKIDHVEGLSHRCRYLVWNKANKALGRPHAIMGTAVPATTFQIASLIEPFPELRETPSQPRLHGSYRSTSLTCDLFACHAIMVGEQDEVPFLWL
jgi:hypothetical protein